MDITVAISGGTDSLFALLSLREAGHRVTALHARGADIPHVAGGTLGKHNGELGTVALMEGIPDLGGIGRDYPGFRRNGAQRTARGYGSEAFRGLNGHGGGSRRDEGAGSIEPAVYLHAGTAGKHHHSGKSRAEKETLHKEDLIINERIGA